ncbi:MAG: DNA-3-methyladenine glycosylase [Proteobacteria bacterium]|nr:MAG: DNA-3-methyladenine glycosylase [Pseudomonadota bacterium]
MKKLKAGAKLPPEFYLQETSQLARALLGKRLVRVGVDGLRRSGLIVETEAYLGIRDAACHTHQGRQTPRVKSMYLEGGHAYIYLIYGMHYCFNVVAMGAGEPEAVLIRALDPDPENFAPPARTDGPGRLCKALGITKELDGASLQGPGIFIEQVFEQDSHAPAKDQISEAPRIGVAYAGEAAAWNLRFYWRGNPFVSVKEKGWKKGSPLIRPSGPTT